MIMIDGSIKTLEKCKHEGCSNAVDINAFPEELDPDGTYDGRICGQVRPQFERLDVMLLRNIANYYVGQTLMSEGQRRGSTADYLNGLADRIEARL